MRVELLPPAQGTPQDYCPAHLRLLRRGNSPPFCNVDRLAQRVDGRRGIPRGRAKAIGDHYLPSPAKTPKTFALQSQYIGHAHTPSFVLVDELWAHKKPDLFRAMRLGAAKVPGSLLVVATTAGRGNDSADFPVYSYAKKVQLGEIEDPSFLPVIFEAPRECDWQDEEVWRAVLPGLEHGYPDLPSLRVLAREAAERPAEREVFRQFYLGIRAEAANSPFVEMAAYDQSAGDPVDLDELAGLPCWLGVDLSSSIDLTVIVAAWSDGAGGYIVHPWFFLPEGQPWRNGRLYLVPPMGYGPKKD